MIYLVIFVLFVWIWIISEWINAKQQDNDSSIKSNDTNSQKV